jgi:hypothetical protein
MVVTERLGACTMKIGDLVKLRFGKDVSPDSVGVVVEEYRMHSASSSHQYSELRVQWLDDGGKDVSWVMGKDLEVVSASR